MAMFSFFLYLFFVVTFNRPTIATCTAMQPWYEETHMFGHVDKPGDVYLG